MEKQKMKQLVEKYINDVKEETYHSILNKNLDVLELDRLKSFFLLLPKLNGEKWIEAMHVASLAVGSAYAGFQAHDTIEEQKAISTEQQLTVLSGDYFSGMHYHLLASLPDFEFIQTLSKAIGKVNEMKTIIHGSVLTEPEELIKTIRVIEADCIKSFLHRFGFSQYAVFSATALPLIFLEQQLLSEKKQAYSWVVDPSIVHQSIAILKEELRIILNEANFLKPVLIDEINEMTTSLLSELT